MFFCQKHLNLFAIMFNAWKFYLKNSTGKSFSNIQITQRPYATEVLAVANM